jgi:hypothetical protein
VNFLDAWTALDPPTLARWLAPAACVTLSLALPGRGAARIGALGVALALPFVPDGGPAWRVALWCALWALVAWRAGRDADVPVARARRALLGGLESGAVGLAIGLALLVLLLAGLARADLGAVSDRRTASALLVLGLGLTHLMLRRRARRAMVSFAAMGLGVQMLESAARAVQGPGARDSGPAVLAATALAVALVDRLAAARDHAVGSDRIALAHDLHD